jgi:hypothetical protein
MKYILVTGGVISGVGKGVIASSFGTILKCSNIHVTSIKIDPYINIDAGTFSPYEHGNSYILLFISDCLMYNGSCSLVWTVWLYFSPCILSGYSCVGHVEP